MYLPHRIREDELTKDSMRFFSMINEETMKMNEEKILNKALSLLNDEGEKSAYMYLLKQKEKRDDWSGQYYNFLYCFAGINGAVEEAKAYLEEAIIEKGFWYRTEVFQDEDLDCIRDTDSFKACLEISEYRYQKALECAETVSTWKEKRKEKLAIALHGNQQNINDAKRSWQFLEKVGYQVECVQSKEIDAHNIFRWEDKGSGPEQLIDAIGKIKMADYDEHILCGFSSGCNTILRTLISFDLPCDTILLQSPWIPMIIEDLQALVAVIEEKDIRLIIVCGTEDVECFGQSLQLYEALSQSAIKVEKHWLEGLDHEFPENFDQLIKMSMAY